MSSAGRLRPVPDVQLGPGRRAADRRSSPRQQSVLPRTHAGSVEKRLAARGFEKTASGTPDLLVHYHASVTQRDRRQRRRTEHGVLRRGWLPPYVYDAGTLLIDLVDARTEQAGLARLGRRQHGRRHRQSGVDGAEDRRGGRANSAAASAPAVAPTKRSSCFSEPSRFGSSCSSWPC